MNLSRKGRKTKDKVDGAESRKPIKIGGRRIKKLKVTLAYEKPLK